MGFPCLITGKLLQNMRRQSLRWLVSRDVKRLLEDGLLVGGTGDVGVLQKEVINPSTTTCSSSSSSPLAEDEQRNKLSSQKALQAVTAEKEAALADLNSVERSLSDIFRRYENMKSTLEGFKKVSRLRNRECRVWRAEFRAVDSRTKGIKLESNQK